MTDMGRLLTEVPTDYKRDKALYESRKKRGLIPSPTPSATAKPTDINFDVLAGIDPSLAARAKASIATPPPQATPVATPSPVPATPQVVVRKAHDLLQHPAHVDASTRKTRIDSLRSTLIPKKPGEEG